MTDNQFSGIFAPIYVCPEHGETWHAQLVEDIDTENDDVFERRVCPDCPRDVAPLLHDGLQVMHPLTVEEVYWETYSEEDEDDYE